MKFLALLAAGTLGLTVQLNAETELIANDKFADDGAAWSIKVSPDSSASLSVVADDGEKALCVDVQEPPQDKEAPPDVRIHRLFGEIGAEKDYKISFKAKADQPVKIIPFIYPENAGSRVLWRVETSLEPEWKEFNFTFKGRDTADNCVLGFSHLGKMANKYYFKDVTLTAE
jgi:uncharacterized protein YggU (UPF0235/DUF167 family)